MLYFGSQITNEIRLKIYNELKFTSSAGIATNKMLAKIASRYNRPNKQTVILPSHVEGNRINSTFYHPSIDERLSTRKAAKVWNEI